MYLSNVTYQRIGAVSIVLKSWRLRQLLWCAQVLAIAAFLLLSTMPSFPMMAIAATLMGLAAGGGADRVDPVSGGQAARLQARPARRRTEPSSGAERPVAAA